jgi:hypothetical protein
MEDGGIQAVKTACQRAISIPQRWKQSKYEDDTACTLGP